MIWAELEAGSKVEAVDTFEVQMGMGAPTGSGKFNVENGDTLSLIHISEPTRPY